MPVKVGVISKMANYFSSLPHRLRVQELGKCDFIVRNTFLKCEISATN